MSPFLILNQDAVPCPAVTVASQSAHSLLVCKFFGYRVCALYFPTQLTSDTCLQACLMNKSILIASISLMLYRSPQWHLKRWKFLSLEFSYVRRSSVAALNAVDEEEEQEEIQQGRKTPQGKEAQRRTSRSWSSVLPRGIRSPEMKPESAKWSYLESWPDSTEKDLFHLPVCGKQGWDYGKLTERLLKSVFEDTSNDDNSLEVNRKFYAKSQDKWRVFSVI